MAFDGNGNFLRLYDWENDAALNIDILPNRMDGEDDNFAAGLSLCLTRDGQGRPNTNISWNNYKLTDLANATLDGDALNRITADGRYILKTGNGTITGDLSVSGVLSVGGTLGVTGSGSFGGSLTVTGGGSFGGDVDMNGHRITELSAPTSASDAATKTYVDSVASTGSAAVSLVTTYALVNSFGGY